VNKSSCDTIRTQTSLLSLSFTLPSRFTRPYSRLDLSSASYSGRLFYGLGVWLDNKLQQVAQQQKSYF
jgi:hypothetical protein